MAAQDSWLFLDVYGTVNGPVSVAELADLLRKGVIGEGASVKGETETTWSRLTDRFPNLIATPPPAPTDAGPVGGVGKRGWTDVAPHPWRRYFARTLDSIVVGGVTWFLIGAVFGTLDPLDARTFFALFDGPAGTFLDAMATTIVVIPGNALLIGLTGLSIGKWVFGVRVLRKDGRPIGLWRALFRELRVLAMGMGFGIPLVSLITLIGSYSSLQDTRSTAWDRQQGNLVLHRPAGFFQGLLVFLGIIVVVTITVALRVMAIRNAAGGGS